MKCLGCIFLDCLGDGVISCWEFCLFSNTMELHGACLVLLKVPIKYKLSVSFQKFRPSCSNHLQNSFMSGLFSLCINAWKESPRMRGQPTKVTLLLTPHLRWGRHNLHLKQRPLIHDHLINCNCFICPCFEIAVVTTIQWRRPYRPDHKIYHYNDFCKKVDQ